MTLHPSELDELDRAILDYLQEDRSVDRGWGIASPALVRDELHDRGFEDLPTRQTIQNRMKILASADHLENIGQGHYRFVSDPRDESE